MVNNGEKIIEVLFFRRNRIMIFAIRVNVELQAVAFLNVGEETKR